MEKGEGTWLRMSVPNPSVKDTRLSPELVVVLPVPTSPSPFLLPSLVLSLVQISEEYGAWAF